MKDHVSDFLTRIPVIGMLVRIAKSIPILGWDGLTLYDILKSYGKGIVYGTFSARAGAISWSFFMSIFPFLLFLLNLIPYVPVENFQEDFLKFIYTFVPNQSYDFVKDVFYDIANTPRGGLLSSVFALSILMMTNGVNAVFSGFEYSYHVTLNRGFIKQYFVALCISILIATVLLSTVLTTLYLTYMIQKLEEFGWVWDNFTWVLWVKYFILLFMVYLIIYILYYFGTHEGKHIRFFSPGAIMTMILVISTTYLFGIYLDNFSRYNELYGSIGALLILMLYIWLNANLLLLGFELNASIYILRQKQSCKVPEFKTVSKSNSSNSSNSSKKTT